MMHVFMMSATVLCVLMPVCVLAQSSGSADGAVAGYRSPPMAPPPQWQPPRSSAPPPPPPQTFATSPCQQPATHDDSGSGSTSAARRLDHDKQQQGNTTTSSIIVICAVIGGALLTIGTVVTIIACAVRCRKANTVRTIAIAVKDGESATGGNRHHCPTVHAPHETQHGNKTNHNTLPGIVLDHCDDGRIAHDSQPNHAPDTTCVGVVIS